MIHARLGIGGRHVQGMYWVKISGRVEDRSAFCRPNPGRVRLTQNQLLGYSLPTTAIGGLARHIFGACVVFRRAKTIDTRKFAVQEPLRDASLKEFYHRRAALPV